MNTFYSVNLCVWVYIHVVLDKAFIWKTSVGEEGENVKFQHLGEKGGLPHVAQSTLFSHTSVITNFWRGNKIATSGGNAPSCPLK